MKPFTMLAVLFLSLLALLQLARVLLGWVVVVNGFAVPLWASALAALVAAGLALMLWRDLSRSEVGARDRRHASSVARSAPEVSPDDRGAADPAPGPALRAAARLCGRRG